MAQETSGGESAEVRRQQEARTARLASFPLLNPNPVIELDVTGAVTFANPAALEVLKTLGYPDDARAFAPPDVADIVRALAQGEPAKFEREIKLGDTVWSAAIHLAPDFQAVRLFAIDITERKRAEEERTRLQLEAERTAVVRDAILDSMAEGLMVADLEGNVLSINPAARRIHGHAPTEDIEKPLDDFVPTFELCYPDGRPAPVEEWPLPRVLRGEAFQGLEMEVRNRADGRLVTVVYGGALVNDRQGQPICAIVTSHNITDLVETRRQLEVAAAEREAVLNSMTEGLMVADLEGNVLSINPAARRIHGIAPTEDIVGPMAALVARRDLYYPDGRLAPVEERPLPRLLRGAAFQGLAMEVRNRETGQAVTVIYGGALVRDHEGQPILTVVTSRDITELAEARRRLEAAGAELERRVQDRTASLQEAMQRLSLANQSLRQATHKLRRQAQQLRALRAIDQAILAAQSPSEIAHEVARAVAEATGALRVMVTLFDFQAAEQQLLAVHGAVLPSYPEGKYPLHDYRLLDENRQGRVGTVEDVAALPDADLKKDQALAAGIRSQTGVPLVVGGEVIGAIVISQAEPGRLAADALEFACQVADQLAIAIQHAQLFEEVRDSRQQLRNLSHYLVALQEEERKSLSRELHDRAGQAMTTLKLGLGLLRREAEGSAALQAHIGDLYRTADEVMEDLHQVAVSLRPFSLDRYGLVAALEQYVQAFQKQSQVAVDFLAAGLEDERLPDEVETALYRIVQEALTNVARHAGAASAGVIVQRRGEQVTLIVEDDGRGFDAAQALASGRLGLLGMRERVEMLGGKLTIESAPGRGTTIFVEAPIGGDSR